MTTNNPLSTEPHERALSDPGLQSLIKNAEVAILLAAKFECESAHARDPQSRIRALEIQIPQMTDAGAILDAQSEIARLTTAGVVAQQNATSRLGQLREAARQATAAALAKAESLLSQWEADGIAAEDDFAAGYGLSGTRSEVSLRYSQELKRCRALLANLQQPTPVNCMPSASHPAHDWLNIHTE